MRWGPAHTKPPAPPPPPAFARVEDVIGLHTQYVDQVRLLPQRGVRVSCATHACGGRHRPTHAVRGPGETAPTKRGEGLLCHPRVWRTSSAYTRKYVDQVRLSCARRGPTRAAAASTLRECSHRSALAPIKRAEEPGPSGRNPLNSAFPAPPPADSGLTRKHTHTRAWGTPRADPSAQGGAGGAAEPLHHVPAGRCGAPPRGRHQLARLRREQPHPLSGTWRSGGAHPQLEQLHHVDESTPTAPHCL